MPGERLAKRICCCTAPRRGARSGGGLAGRLGILAARGLVTQVSQRAPLESFAEVQNDAVETHRE
jgi:hypothetical protein